MIWACSMKLIYEFKAWHEVCWKANPVFEKTNVLCSDFVRYLVVNPNIDLLLWCIKRKFSLPPKLPVTQIQNNIKEMWRTYGDDALLTACNHSVDWLFCMSFYLHRVRMSNFLIHCYVIIQPVISMLYSLFVRWRSPVILYVIWYHRQEVEGRMIRPHLLNHSVPREVRHQSVQE